MAATSPNKRVVIAALAILYFVWGSTYLAIRFGLEGFPPFLLEPIDFASIYMAQVQALQEQDAQQGGPADAEGEPASKDS